MPDGNVVAKAVFVWKHGGHFARASLKIEALERALESDPATRTPIADKSFEHAHSVLEFSSARTPKMDLLPNARAVSNTAI